PQPETPSIPEPAPAPAPDGSPEAPTEPAVATQAAAATETPAAPPPESASETTITPAPEPEPPELTDAEMLDDVCSFIGHYLSCTEEQRIILALWVLHTHCYTAFENLPYLNIRSPEHESGKTTCLQILNLLCAKPWFVTGANASVLIRKITEDRPTLLLDDWEVTFRSEDRQSITGFLISGSKNIPSYAVPERDRGIDNANVCCPKAFAGATPLPP